MSAQASRQKDKVLVVDDTPNNLQLLLTALTGEGYEVRCAKSGRLALSGAQAMSPDLILLDILMPQMDGYEVCQLVKTKYTDE
jgi:CheY-like chemotaxis protein